MESVSQSQVLPFISLTSITIKLGVWFKSALEDGKDTKFKLVWDWNFKPDLTSHKQKWPESHLYRMCPVYYLGNEEWGYDAEQLDRKYK